MERRGRGLIVWGSHAHLERYITPQRGLGYWLGHHRRLDDAAAADLLGPQARAWLRWLGGIPAWFEIHMVLGIVGPLLVLFHANFHLGATNSNVALICMLVVAGSGVIGRYIYTRMHAHLDGNEDTLEQLQGGRRTAALANHLDLLPAGPARCDRPSGGALDRASEGTRAPLPAPVHGRRRAGARALAGASRNQARRGESRSCSESALIAACAAHRRWSRASYADRRLEAGRRVAEYQMYARLFSLWHVLHIPLFFMLLIAGIVHVIAINVY